MNESNAETETVPSESDDRTVNNLMRHRYRVLTETEKAQMLELKDRGLDLVKLLHDVGGTQPMINGHVAGQGSRELSIAQTKIEEAVMWAVKHVTG